MNLNDDDIELDQEKMNGQGWVDDDQVDKSNRLPHAIIGIQTGLTDRLKPGGHHCRTE